MDEQVKKFIDALKRDDDKAGMEAAAEIASGVLSDLRRIANALDHIARNTPPK